MNKEIKQYIAELKRYDVKWATARGIAFYLGTNRGNVDNTATTMVYRKQLKDFIPKGDGLIVF